MCNCQFAMASLSAVKWQMDNKFVMKFLTAGMGQTNLICDGIADRWDGSDEWKFVILYFIAESQNLCFK